MCRKILLIERLDWLALEVVLRKHQEQMLDALDDRWWAIVGEQRDDAPVDAPRDFEKYIKYGLSYKLNIQVWIEQSFGGGSGVRRGKAW